MENIIASEVYADRLPMVFMDLYKRRHPKVNIQDGIKVWSFAVSYKGKYCGFAELVLRSKRFFPFEGYWIHGFFVKPRFRRSGIGQLLIRQIIDRAAKENASCIFLLVRVTNKAAIYLYLKNNFRFTTVGAIENQVLSSQDAQSRQILMARKING